MLAMACYAETGKGPRIPTEREQMLLLKISDDLPAGFRNHVLYATWNLKRLGWYLRLPITEHRIRASELRTV